MEKIQKTASQIQNGTELDRRIEVDSRFQDEFYRLANTFNEMLNKIQISFENEKQFSGDASHELRTPLAVIRAVAEEMESELEKGEQMENDKLGEQKELVKLHELIEVIVEEMREVASREGITITTNCEEDCIVEGDQMLFTRMLVNLIDNGIGIRHEAMKKEGQGLDSIWSGGLCTNTMEKYQYPACWEKAAVFS